METPIRPGGLRRVTPPRRSKFRRLRIFILCLQLPGSVGMCGEEPLVFGVQACDERFNQQKLSLDNLNTLFSGLVLYGSPGRIGVVCVEKEPDAEDRVANALLLRRIEFVLQAVKARVLLGTIVGHVGQSAGVLRGLPAYVIESNEAVSERHLLVDLRLWILDHLIQKNYVLLEGVLLLVNIGQDTLECAFVRFDFRAETRFGLLDEGTMVLPFNTSL